MQLNILINDQGGALLSNFGLGTAIGEKRTGLPTTVGFNDDIRYCSPEALKTDKLKTPSDIWAWGCIALEVRPVWASECLCGSRLSLYRP